MDLAEAAAQAVRERAGGREPRVGIVLGSGLGGCAERVERPLRIPFAEIPHFPIARVAGHAGNLILGEIRGVTVAAVQGRFHYYEGHELAITTLPIRVLALLGATTVVLTAASGGINRKLGPGSLVCVSDHLNLIGENPLRGPHDERLGVRFPDMTEVYSKRLRELAFAAARASAIDLAQGVYACLPGPSYETPAEIAMLRTLGADVVGMSMAPEAIVARHAGLEVLGISIVANAAAGVMETPITHQEVLEAVSAAAPRVGTLIEAVLGAG